MSDPIIKRADNFVSPGESHRMEIVPASQLPPVPISPPMPHSSHADRSRGFVLVTAPLAAATGFIVLLIGITAFGIPILSVAALLLALAGFALTWLAAFALHVWVSPDGALFLYTILVFRLLFLEAKERRKRYGKR